MMDLSGLMATINQTIPLFIQIAILVAVLSVLFGTLIPMIMSFAKA